MTGHPPGTTPVAPPIALEARDLRKRYGDTAALDGFDLTVGVGTVHALLGPNGAGKSTAVGCLSTLTRYDAGTATIAGVDVRGRPHEVRRRIGVVGQAAALDEVLHGRENLVLFGRLHGLTTHDAAAGAEELLARFDLTGAADRKVSTYSGGMRRRLDIAGALVRRPSLLFLDEPTTGLDPRARNEVWAAVRRIVEAGTTVLLTTQYLDEADQLADVVTVMQHGRVIAGGTPGELKTRLGGDRVIVTLPMSARPDAVREALADGAAGPVLLDEGTRQVTVDAGDEGGAAALFRVVRTLDGTGVAVDDVVLRRPTLDEVFLHLTEGATR
jgi:ABC-2 type transport system ATP-binding protein